MTDLDLRRAEANRSTGTTPATAATATTGTDVLRPTGTDVLRPTAALRTTGTAARPTTATATLVSALAFLFTSASVAPGQEVPLVGQPMTNFYGAVGTAVRVTWRLDRAGDPVEVAENEEFVATLTVSGVSNPAKVTRPDLKALDEFRERFVIRDGSDPPPAATGTEVSFSYQLRPRDRRVTELPALEFHYFNPTAAVGKQFKTTVARPVRLRVTAAPEKRAEPAVPLQEPEHLFAVTTGPEVLAAPRFTPGRGWWLGLAVAGPMAAGGWYWVWRRLYPDGPRLARLARSRATRRASEAIRRAGASSEPPAALAWALIGYLRERHRLPAAAVTPGEVATALRELGMASGDVEAVTAFLRSCDAARFSATSDSGRSLTTEAVALLARLEAS